MCIFHTADSLLRESGSTIAWGDLGRSSTIDGGGDSDFGHAAGQGCSVSPGRRLAATDCDGAVWYITPSTIREIDDGEVCRARGFHLTEVDEVLQIAP